MLKSFGRSLWHFFVRPAPTSVALMVGPMPGAANDDQRQLLRRAMWAASQPETELPISESVVPPKLAVVSDAPAVVPAEELHDDGDSVEPVASPAEALESADLDAAPDAHGEMEARSCDATTDTPVGDEAADEAVLAVDAEAPETAWEAAESAEDESLDEAGDAAAEADVEMPPEVDASLQAGGEDIPQEPCQALDHQIDDDASDALPEGEPLPAAAETPVESLLGRVGDESGDAEEAPFDAVSDRDAAAEADVAEITAFAPEEVTVAADADETAPVEDVVEVDEATVPAEDMTAHGEDAPPAEEIASVEDLAVQAEEAVEPLQPVEEEAAPTKQRKKRASSPSKKKKASTKSSSRKSKAKAVEAVEPVPEDDVWVSDAVAWSLSGEWIDGEWHAPESSDCPRRLEELRELAAEGKLTVWGRSDDTDVWLPIEPSYWKSGTVEPSSLFEGRENVVAEPTGKSKRKSARKYSALKVSRSQVEEIWHPGATH